MTGQPTEPESFAFAWFLHYQYDPGEFQAWVRDQRWKLYHDGRLYDVEKDVLKEQPIARGQGEPEAEAAHSRLQNVLHRIDVAGDNS